MASDETPVEKITQLSCIAAAFADCTIALSALMTGFNFENHLPMMAAVEVEMRIGE